MSQTTLIESGTPTSLDDATATRMGLKRYSHGTTYNGGIAPTITAPGNTVASAYGNFIPYQMQDGSWRCRINMRVAITAAAGTITVSIVGLTTAANDQSLSIGAGTNASYFYCLFQGGAFTSSQIFASMSGSGNSSACSISGDVDLGGKPTWAY